MANQRYESTYIIDGNLQEDQLDQIIQKVEENITKNGGELIETERWGRRKLAYDIDKITSGFYVSQHFTAPGAVIAKLERHYQLDEQIIRWLTLVMPEANMKGRAAMKKRLEEVSARRERDSKAAELAEIEAQNAPRAPRKIEEEALEDIV